MFTGIITHVGKLEKKEKSVFTFSAPRGLMRKLKKGTSLAVNGCCLTVNNFSSELFSVEVMPETQKKTMFGSLQSGSMVNLELPVLASSFLSGHIVQGHIDGVGTVKRVEKEGNSRILTITVPKSIMHYIVAKGSIAINGISLTVISVNKNSFTVGITAYTWEHTMLHLGKIGDLVNIETDIVAKYIEKFVSR